MSHLTFKNRSVIYIFTEEKKQGGTLYTHLQIQGKGYRKRGSTKDKRAMIVGRVDIEKRPKIVDKCIRFRGGLNYG